MNLSNPVDVPFESLQLTRFVVKRILAPVIVSSGIIGNIFNIIVLRSPKMKSSTNVYLMCLAICDTLYLIFTLTLSFLSCSSPDQSYAAFQFVPKARVLSDIFGNTAVWLTVAFTLERYIGVCYPMKGKAWCTVGKAKIVSLLVFCVCFANTLPEFFELEINGKITVNNDTTEIIYKCITTDFGDNESYKIGYYWWFVTFFTLIPFAFLSIFNTILIRSVWRANKRRSLLSNSIVVGESSRQSVEQQRVTTMLITVVLIFLLCQLPWTVLLLYRAYLSANEVNVPYNFIRIAGNICNLLVQINASMNFLLYSYFSSRFRRTFKLLFCKWRKKYKRKSKMSYSGDTFRKSGSSKDSTTITSASSCKSKRGTIYNSCKQMRIPIEEKE